MGCSRSPLLNKYLQLVLMLASRLMICVSHHKDSLSLCRGYVRLTPAGDEFVCQCYFPARCVSFCFNLKDNMDSPESLACTESTCSSLVVLQRVAVRPPAWPRPTGCKSPPKACASCPCEKKHVVVTRFSQISRSSTVVASAIVFVRPQHSQPHFEQFKKQRERNFS